ncbi:hypothetical protein [Actinomycetospora chiangmaiensis]|uniref:hypothetical protein n=1 Tax=Actinomycetospora chiangmaiensis TaxID=402650 RepID=UPI0003631B92|nr:hypothetical protein [Actinomycetospora chiangmaiensis]
MDTVDHGGPDDGLARLRAAAAAVENLDDPASGTDAAEHADRFEALHEALTGALAAVDRG